MGAHCIIFFFTIFSQSPKTQNFNTILSQPFVTIIIIELSLQGLGQIHRNFQEIYQLKFCSNGLFLFIIIQIIFTPCYKSFQFKKFQHRISKVVVTNCSFLLPTFIGPCLQLLLKPGQAVFVKICQYILSFTR